MKVARFERRLVNSARHSRGVAEHAVRVLLAVPHREGESYLDVGCGNGAAALRIADSHRLVVTGVDVDPDQIRTAREAAGARSDVSFEVADATRLTFEDESFDIVATYKTMHHVPRWEAAVAEMVRVLKPGGRLIYADLVMPGWLAAIGRRIAGKQAGFVTRDGLRCLVEAEGLRVVQQQTIGPVYQLVSHRPCGSRHCARDRVACRCRAHGAAK